MVNLAKEDFLSEIGKLDGLKGIDAGRTIRNILSLEDFVKERGTYIIIRDRPISGKKNGGTDVFSDISFVGGELRLAYVRDDSMIPDASLRKPEWDVDEAEGVKKQVLAYRVPLLADWTFRYDGEMGKLLDTRLFFSLGLTELSKMEFAEEFAGCYFGKIATIIGKRGHGANLAQLCMARYGFGEKERRLVDSLRHK